MGTHLDRVFKESPIYHGVREKRAYQLTVPTSWGTTPTSPTATMINAAGTDISSTALSGAASVASQVITLPYIEDDILTAGQTYELRVAFLIGSNELEAFGYVVAQ